MKNPTIFVDVDLTLVDANGRLQYGAREALEQLKEKGCHLYLWSTGGTDYCRKVAELYKLEHFFEGFSGKPDVVIDDMPATCLQPYVYDVHKEGSWGRLADKIIDHHVS